jgi:signal peptidase I
MNIFVTPDGLAYRRWINIIPSVFLAGSGQFLSGRRRAGVLWFMAISALLFASRFSVLAPIFKSIVPAIIVGAILIFAWLLMLADACRKPMPRLGAQTWLLFTGAVLVVATVSGLYSRQFAGEPFRMPTDSMQPTLIGNHKTPAGMVYGDRVVVYKLAYAKHRPQRGDIVVFKTSGILFSPASRHPISSNMVPPNKFFAKRVVGVPGDKVSICPPFVCINGRELADPPFFQTMASGTGGYSGYLNGGMFPSLKDEIVLGPDEYFVLGDNSSNSLDSRHFGPIKCDSIVGKVNWIYWPPGRRGAPE